MKIQTHAGRCGRRATALVPVIVQLVLKVTDFDIQCLRDKAAKEQTALTVLLWSSKRIEKSAEQRCVCDLQENRQTSIRIIATAAHADQLKPADRNGLDEALGTHLVNP